MTTTEQKPPSTLTSLRRLIPARSCLPEETRQIAEAQATRLVAILGDAEGPQVSHIDAMPRIAVRYERLPVSGLSHWNGRQWIICLNTEDSPARQRFTLLHEFKHIIDHGACDRLYRDVTRRGVTLTARQQAETAADYFAGCALVPKRELKRAWGLGIQRIDDLAAHFGVSQHAIEVRLDQTGLSREVDPEPEMRTENQGGRCARPISTRTWQPQRFRFAQHRYPRRSFV